jgi:hypothetical protein
LESSTSQVPTNPCEGVGSSLATFVYTNREIKSSVANHEERKSKLRSRDEVIQEALSMLGVSKDKADKYTSVDLRLGYKAAPVHCTQTRMYLVYQVDFAAPGTRLPPRTVEVPAQDLPEARKVEATWDCSSE